MPGLDGGTTISRSDVLRGSSWALATADDSRSTRGGAVTGTYAPPALTVQAQRTVHWTTCSLSEQPLQHAHIVADALGSLFNKEAVVEYLLCRKGLATDEAALHRFTNQLSKFGTRFEHVRSLKDVFALHFTANTADDAAPGPSARAAASGSSSSGAGGGGGTANPAPFLCPITLLPCGGVHAFAALRPCGHAFSERALSAIAGSDAACPTCSRPFKPGDVIPLNPGPEKRAELKQRLEERQQAKQDKAAARGGGGGGGGGGRQRGSKRAREEAATPAAGAADA